MTRVFFLLLSLWERLREGVFNAPSLALPQRERESFIF